MKVLKIIAMLCILALSGCAALDKTPWKNEAGAYEEITVRWLRMAGNGFVDQDGICTVQAVDSEAGLKVFYSQVENCRMGAALRAHATEQMKAVAVKKFRLYVVRTSADVENYYAGQYGMRNFKAISRRAAEPICWEGIDCRGIVGFEFEGDGWSGIVIGQRYMSELGHEFKHIVDGYFHYASGRWKSAGTAFTPEPTLTSSIVP